MLKVSGLLQAGGENLSGAGVLEVSGLLRHRKEEDLWCPRNWEAVCDTDLSPLKGPENGFASCFFDDAFVFSCLSQSAILPLALYPVLFAFFFAFGVDCEVLFVDLRHSGTAFP